MKSDNIESQRKFDDIDFKNLTMRKLVELCMVCETKEDANELLRRYEKCFDDPAIARDNLGYMFGYYDQKVREKLYALFPVNHPLFGSKFGRGGDPSPEEAFKIGEKIGDKINEDLKKYRKDEK